MQPLPFDISGRRKENRQVEKVPKEVGNWDLIIPLHTPFFTRDLILADHRTGYILKPNKDFVAIEALEDYSARAQSEIACFIVLLDRRFSSTLTMEYSSLGQVPKSIIPTREEIAHYSKDLIRQPVWGESIREKDVVITQGGKNEHYGHLINTLEHLNTVIQQGDVEQLESTKRVLLKKHLLLNEELQVIRDNVKHSLVDDRLKLITAISGKHGNLGDGIIHEMITSQPCISYDGRTIKLPKPICYKDYSANALAVTVERLSEDGDVVYLTELTLYLTDQSYPLLLSEINGLVLEDWLLEDTGLYRISRTNMYGGVTRDNHIAFPAIVIDKGVPENDYVTIVDMFLEVAQLDDVDQYTINRWMKNPLKDQVLKYEIAKDISENHDDPVKQRLAARWIYNHS